MSVASSAADFRVRGGHGAFRAHPEDEDKIRRFEQMLGFPVARSTLCRAMQRLARRAKPTRDALVEALRASPVVYADETGCGSGCGSSRTCARPSTRTLPGRGFAGRLGAGYAVRGRRLGPLPLLQGSDATDLLQPSAAPLPRATRPRAGRCASPLGQGSSGTPSPWAIGACWRGHGLRVAKGLLQAKMNRLLHGRFTNPANQRFAKHLRRYRDNLFVFLDRADVEARTEQDIRSPLVTRPASTAKLSASSR